MYQIKKKIISQNYGQIEVLSGGKWIRKILNRKYELCMNKKANLVEFQEKT